MRVLTLGTFDLAHSGHLNIIHRCRERAGPGVVIVAVNTDEFVERYKGRLPVMPYTERAGLVAALRDVDQVVPNAQPDGSAIDVVARAKPDVICAGADWGDRWFGQVGISAQMFERMAIEIEFVPYTEGVSSSDIRSRL